MRKNRLEGSPLYALLEGLRAVPLCGLCWGWGCSLRLGRVVAVQDPIVDAFWDVSQSKQSLAFDWAFLTSTGNKKGMPIYY